MFVFLSYLFGHLLSAAAGWWLDPLYDRRYAQPRYHREPWMLACADTRPACSHVRAGGLRRRARHPGPHGEPLASRLHPYRQRAVRPRGLGSHGQPRAPGDPRAPADWQADHHRECRRRGEPSHGCRDQRSLSRRLRAETRDSTCQAHRRSSLFGAGREPEE